jgi:hypothetical protein
MIVRFYWAFILKTTFCAYKRKANWHQLKVNWFIIKDMSNNNKLCWYYLVKHQITNSYYYMSRVTTKPIKCVCDQHGSRPACASAQSDQDPCCLLTNSILSRETDSAGWSGSMLVANPLSWFCRDTAHICILVFEKHDAILHYYIFILQMIKVFWTKILLLII